MEPWAFFGLENIGLWSSAINSLFAFFLRARPIWSHYYQVSLQEEEINKAPLPLHSFFQLSFSSCPGDAPQTKDCHIIKKGKKNFFFLLHAWLGKVVLFLLFSFLSTWAKYHSKILNMIKNSSKARNKYLKWGEITVWKF